MVTATCLTKGLTELVLAGAITGYLGLKTFDGIEYVGKKTIETCKTVFYESKYSELEQNVSNLK